MFSCSKHAGVITRSTDPLKLDVCRNGVVHLARPSFSHSVQRLAFSGRLCRTLKLRKDNSPTCAATSLCLGFLIIVYGLLFQVKSTKKPTHIALRNICVTLSLISLGIALCFCSPYGRFRHTYVAITSRSSHGTL